MNAKDRFEVNILFRNIAYWINETFEKIFSTLQLCLHYFFITMSFGIAAILLYKIFIEMTAK